MQSDGVEAFLAASAKRVGCADAGKTADTAVATWHAISAALSPIIGTGGVAALYKRSLYLTRPAYPWLDTALQAALAACDFSALHLALSEQADCDAAAASTTLLETFCDILTRLIGPSLTVQIVEQAIHLPASIGTAVYPEDGEDAQTPIDRADAAMHRGKLKTGKLDARRLDPGSEAARVGAPRQGAASFARGRAGHAHDPFRQLREANEELVLAALTAQELQATAEATLHRQIASFAILTHELRNVLAPIQTAANLLKQIRSMREPLLPKLQAVIERQTEHMGRLVGDLLDGSRASTGRFRLERCLVELTSVIAQALDSCRCAFDLRRQQVAIRLPSGPLRIYGDPVRLVQVFVNLLDNASKYALEGGEIEIDVARRGQMVEVIVSDNGIGISADVLPHVFDLFVRDAPVRGIRSDGLGIGLAVVRELVEAHGGTVTAESAGRALGSKFIVALPTVDSGAVSTTP